MRVKTRNRGRFRHLRSFIIVGVLLVIAAALVVGSRVGFIRLPFLSKIPEYTIVPVQRMFNGVALWFENRFADKRELEAENIRLSNELRAMQMENEAAAQLRAENERLRALLGFTESSANTYLGAAVIAMSPGNWFSTFTLDKGADDGVQVDMAVVSQDGLIGRVIEITDTYCVVRSIIDSSSAVAGVVERTRDHTIVKGSMSVSTSGDLLQMVYTVTDTELLIGDRVYSSGMDEIFPKGVLIGQVRSIAPQTDGSQNVVLSPAVDFRHIEEALILISDQEAQP